MQTIVKQLEKAFGEAIQQAFGFAVDPLVAVAGNDKFGDYQANAAMGLAKELGKRGQKTNPRAVAEAIIGKLQLGEMAQEVSVAGPGFINVRLSPAFVARELEAIAGDERLGVEVVADPQTVVIDYSGPNIAKELHVGHLRSTIIGDAVSRVIEFQGQKVIRQNHLGDWGTQFGMLIALLEDSQEASGAPVLLKDLEAFYIQAKKRFDEDAAFQARARENVVKLQGGDPATLAAWRALVDKTREHFQAAYERMNVLLRPEHERGESFYNPRLAGVVKELKGKGLAVESEGATVVNVPGFESPLIIEKTGGGYLYGTTDLAAVRYRVGELGGKRVIYFVDSRQAQHFAQVFWTAKEAGWTDSASLEHAAFGTMLGEDGRPFKTRTGGVVKLADLLDEAEERALKLVTDKNPDLPQDQREKIAHAVGIGAIKYADLSKDRTSDYVFSWDSMLSMEGNTAPYMQYAYARVRSIFRKAGGDEHGRAAHATISLGSPFEIALAKQILRFGEIVDLVARELKPHHLCSYLYDLASRFSGFYENCPVLKSEEPLRSSRLALADLTARTMAKGLELLGIEHPDQM